MGPAPPPWAVVSTAPNPSGERGSPTDSSAGYMLNSHTADKSIVTMMLCTQFENLDIYQLSLAPSQNAREHSPYQVRMGTSLRTRATHVSFARTDFRAGAGAALVDGWMDGWPVLWVESRLLYMQLYIQPRLAGYVNIFSPFIYRYASTYPPAINISSAHALPRDGSQVWYACRLPRYLSAGSI